MCKAGRWLGLSSALERRRCYHRGGARILQSFVVGSARLVVLCCVDANSGLFVEHLQTCHLSKYIKPACLYVVRRQCAEVEREPAARLRARYCCVEPTEVVEHGDKAAHTDVEDLRPHSHTHSGYAVDSLASQP